MSRQRRSGGEARRRGVLLPLTVAVFLALPLGACIIVRTPTVQAVRPDARRVVEAPVRAFLADGSVVVFLEGVRVLPGRLGGRGTRYDLTRTSSVPVNVLPLDSVVGIQSFETPVEPGLTVLASVGTTTVGFIVAVFSLCQGGGCAVGSAP